MSLPNLPGAKWFKFDFHTHTPASLDSIWAKQNYDLKPQDWLLKFMQAGIDCIAVTDHNSGSWIDKLNNAYNEMQKNQPEGFREITIFPGVELSVSGGVHLLVIFELGTSSDDIGRFLGAVSYFNKYGETDDVTEISLTEVLKVIKSGQFNCVAIPAHTDKDKGLLQVLHETRKPVLDDQTLRQCYKSKAIVAIEVVDNNAGKPQSYLDSCAGWAEVIGSDCHNFRDKSAPGSRFTWIKMEKPSLESLKLALLDGQDFAIRRFDDGEFNPYQTPDYFIESINIKDARYMGQGKQGETFRFSPYANSIVGGRGTGKSTVTHSLRIATDRASELEANTTPEKTFTNFCKLSEAKGLPGALKQSTSITVIYWRQGERYRLDWDQKAEVSTVYEWISNDWKISDDQSVAAERFPLDLYSQGQIATLVGDNKQALLELIDRTADIDKSALASAELSFSAIRAEMRKLDQQVKQRPIIKRQLEDTKKKITRLSQTDNKTVLQQYEVCKRQNNLYLQQKAGAEAAIQTLKESLEHFGSRFTGYGDPKVQFDDDLQSYGTEMATAIGRNTNAMLAMVTTLELELQDLEKKLLNSQWSRKYQSANADYTTLQQSLQQAGLNNLNDYEALLREETRLKGQLEVVDKAETEFNAKKNESIILRESIKFERKKITNKRQGFLITALSSNPYVRICVLPFSADLSVMEKSFRDFLGVTTQFSTDIFAKTEDGYQGVIYNFQCASKLQEEDRDKAINEIQAKLYKTAKGHDTQHFSGRFNNKLKTLDSQHHDFSDSLLNWYPEDGLNIEYSRKGDGKNFENISQGSAGQKAAAMLAFILAHSKKPLFIDQPEDDLDNSLIYDLIVSQIKNTKIERQIITVTHNPNIVVNGDSEMVHALDFNHQCYVKAASSIQDGEMRNEICRIMEGGKTAFDNRYKRLA